MKSEELWTELEDEVRRGFSGPLLSRRASTHPGHRIMIGIETTSSSRVLMVGVDEFPSRANLPDCSGIEIQIAGSAKSQKYLIVKLTNGAFADVFSILADDIISKAENTEPFSNVDVVLGRLREWQRFLALKNEGLSVERQRGLWGELTMLAEHVIPICGAVAGVSSWKGPLAAHQDFQFPRGALEVKVTTAKAPMRVKITSERQLDAPNQMLFLHAFLLDERDAGAPSAKTGSTLPEVIAVIRSLLSLESVARTEFDAKLVEAGWVDAWSARYEKRRWAIRESATFQVTEEFPKVVESMLMPGVSEVSYSVTLLGCDDLKRGIGDSIKRLSR